MSEYTREKILKLIEVNGGPDDLDLSGKALSGIDLSKEAIAAELEKARDRSSDETPVWYSEETGGINLAGVYLREAHLNHANLQGARLSGANLIGAGLLGANLQGSFLVKAFLQGAFLWEANLEGANLFGANLKRAILVKANLQGAILEEAYLQGADLRFADLREIDLLDVETGGLLGIRLWRAKLDHTALKREQLGAAIGDEQAGLYEEARDAYLALKQSFENLGDYAASAWAYQKERQMEKACSAPWRARDVYDRIELYDASWGKVLWFWIRGTIRDSLKWASDWFVEYLCGYGESIGRVLFWMFASLFGFAAYYWQIGGVWLVAPNGEAKVATSFWHYLIYSAGAFTTTQFARLQAADDRVRMVTAIQAVVGIVLAGLLGFVVGNRIRRS
ncbi:MAG: pentapeptide repeat-containing protein [Dehalococcoidia bacterium]|nr:pentapeptide repeat-containing protein [Dehalococcoidia bacterium]